MKVSFDKRPIVILRIGYMKSYDRPGDIHSDAEFIRDKKTGAEVLNFKSYAGTYYAYGTTPNSAGLDLSSIDGSRNRRSEGDFLEGVDAVFVAPCPVRGLVVVGWYRNVVAYHKQYLERDNDHIPGLEVERLPYLFKGNSPDVVLLPEEGREFHVPYGKKGFMGTAHVWYPMMNLESNGVEDYVVRLREYMDSNSELGIASQIFDHIPNDHRHGGASCREHEKQSEISTIKFDSLDPNFVLEKGMHDRLTALAAVHWEKSFRRDSLKVYFVSERQFQEDVQDNAPEAWESAVSGEPLQHDHGNAPTEYLGCYFPFHEKLGTDIVFICPERIERIVGNLSQGSADFSLLTSSVVLHELAHSLMVEDVLSQSIWGVYLINSGRDIEESLCNAFSLMHFAGAERMALASFFEKQPAGYRSFGAWGSSSPAILSHIQSWSSMIFLRAVELQVLHKKFSIDLLSHVQATISCWPKNEEWGASLALPPDRQATLDVLTAVLQSGGGTQELRRMKTVMANVLKMSGMSCNTSASKIVFDKFETHAVKQLIEKIGFSRHDQTNIFFREIGNGAAKHLAVLNWGCVDLYFAKNMELDVLLDSLLR